MDTSGDAGFAPQHFLYLLPDPHGHGAFLLVAAAILFFLKIIWVWLFFVDEVYRPPLTRWMKPLLFSSDMKGPVLLKDATEISGPQLEHGFGHRGFPTHPRPLHAVLDQVLAGPLYHAGSDGPALLEVVVVAHAVPIAVEVSRDGIDGLELAAAQPPLGGALPHPLDDLADLSSQEAQGPLLDPSQGLGAFLLVEGIGSIPELVHSVLEIQHQGDCRQASFHGSLQELSHE